MSAIRVTDSLSNSTAHMVEAVRAIGRSAYKRKIFEAVYYHKKRIKTVGEIAETTGLTRMQVLQSGVELFKAGIIDQTRKDDDTAYGQIPFFQRNKTKIIRAVDDPKRLRTLSMESGPSATTESSRSPPSSARRRGPSRQKLKVLYLTAAPASQIYIRTEAEFRTVQSEVRGSRFRDDIELHIAPAADTKSLLDGINDHRPQLVHFSGHGGRGSIWLDDGKVTKSVGQAMNFKLLSDALGATSSPPILLVLNACDTLKGADILLSSVKVVVAMSAKISDIGAVTFAAQFYAAIASGQPVQAALDQGKIMMKSAMLSDAHLPEMICRPNIDPNKLKLVG